MNQHQRVSGTFVTLCHNSRIITAWTRQPRVSSSPVTSSQVLSNLEPPKDRLQTLSPPNIIILGVTVCDEENQRFSLPLSVVFLSRLIRVLYRKTTATSQSGCCWGRGWNAKALTGILKIFTQIYMCQRTGKAGMELWVTPITHYIWFDYLSWI